MFVRESVSCRLTDKKSGFHHSRRCTKKERRAEGEQITVRKKAEEILLRCRAENVEKTKDFL